VFAREFAILPAFGDFTGLGDVERSEGDRIYAVAENQVMEVSS
jgi:hypothetical protein